MRNDSRRTTNSPICSLKRSRRFKRKPSPIKQRVKVNGEATASNADIAVNSDGVPTPGWQAKISQDICKLKLRSSAVSAFKD